jgi:hypothetical protein
VPLCLCKGVPPWRTQTLLGQAGVMIAPGRGLAELQAARARGGAPGAAAEEGRVIGPASLLRLLKDFSDALCHEAAR